MFADFFFAVSVKVAMALVTALKLRLRGLTANCPVSGVTVKVNDCATGELIVIRNSPLLH
jgi:hypothetical protein